LTQLCLIQEDKEEKREISRLLLCKEPKTEEHTNVRRFHGGDRAWASGQGGLKGGERRLLEKKFKGKPAIPRHGQ